MRNASSTLIFCIERCLNAREVLPEDTYNMDEKGFMIGVIRRARRFFDRVLYEAKQYKQLRQDSNREWVTVLVTTCADGATLLRASSFQQLVLQFR